MPTALPPTSPELDAVCDTWNRLIAEPNRIQSLGSRQWAAGS